MYLTVKQFNYFYISRELFIVVYVVSKKEVIENTRMNEPYLIEGNKVYAAAERHNLCRSRDSNFAAPNIRSGVLTTTALPSRAKIWSFGDFVDFVSFDIYLYTFASVT